MTTSESLSSPYRGIRTESDGEAREALQKLPQSSHLSHIQAPSNVQALFPSMHTLSALPGIEDNTRYSGKMTTHFDFDVGIFSAANMLIGRGSQFEVRKLTLCCNRGSYAQKSVAAAFKDAKSNPEQLERQRNAVFLEFRALSHPPISSHPNIVRLLDLGWETDPEEWREGVKWPVLLLEYADRGTLKDLLESLKLSLDTKMKLCLDIARGLAMLHDCGIVHGDVKVDNVLIFTNFDTDVDSFNRYTAKLGDFGTSLAEPERKSKISHTKPWNCPEYLEYVDPAGLQQTDVYSFGLLIWSTTFDGRSPFAADKTVAEFLVHQEWDPSFMFLKKMEGGERLLQLAKNSLMESFNDITPPLAALDATLQLQPKMRNLNMSIASLEKYLDIRGFKMPDNYTVNINSFPSLRSHSISIPSSRLAMLKGPLKSYLMDWVQAISPSSDGKNSAPLSIIAEVELDDWLQGRSEGDLQVVSSYLRISSPSIYEGAILRKLRKFMAFPNTEPFNNAIRGCRNRAFNAGYTPTLVDLHRTDRQWLKENLWIPLVCNGGGIGPPLKPDLLRSLLNSEDSSVEDALRRAFPDISNGTDDITSCVLQDDFGHSAIHVLSQAGATSLLKQLLSIPGIDINARNNIGETPLLLACRVARFTTTMALIEAGADVNVHNSYQENVLHWIHSFQFSPDEMEQVAKSILSKGSRDLLRTEAKFRMSQDIPEHPCIEGTPILRAIVKGCNEAAELLWKLESEAFAPEKPNYASISLAAQLHNYKLLDFFLDSPNDLIHPISRASLLGKALGQGCWCDNGMGRILRHGERYKESGIATLRMLCKYGVMEHLDEVPGYPTCSALTIAVYTSPPEVVEFLLNEFGCSRFVNMNSMPPSVAAAHSKGEEIKYDVEAWKSPLLYTAHIADKPSVFKSLLEHGADVHFVKGTEDGELNMMHVSVIESHDATYVKMILESGRMNDVDATLEDFESPFATAVRMRKFDMARRLLEHGADPNRFAVKGCRYFPEPPTKRTVLGMLLSHSASSLSTLACIGFLLDTKKVSMYTTPDQDETVLHCLALFGSQGQSHDQEEGILNKKAVHLLNNHFQFTKEQLDTRRADSGWTALHYAVYNAQSVLVEELLKIGASWDVVSNNSPVTALTLAIGILRTFPQGVRTDGNCPSKESQLKMAFQRRRYIVLLLCRMARDRCAVSIPIK